MSNWTPPSCTRCTKPVGTKWWQKVPGGNPAGGYGNLCDPCHDEWMKEREMDANGKPLIEDEPKLDLESYWDHVLVTAEPKVEKGVFNLKCLLHAAVGVSSESGELLDHVKRVAFYGSALDRTNVIEECGDLLWYIGYCLRSVGATGQDAMMANVRKLDKRYGGKFSTEKAENRDLVAERQALEGGEGAGAK